MNTKTDQYLCEKNINFQTPDHNQLTIKVFSLALTQQEQEVTECRLILIVDFNLYQQIEQANWFNLSPEVRHPIYGGELNPQKKVEIEVALHPELIPELLEIVNNAKGGANFLEELSLNQTISSPFLHTENWYVFYVKQVLELPPELAQEGSSLKVGYSTDYAQQAQEAREEREQELLKTGVENDNSSHYMLDLAINFFQEKGWDFTQLKLGESDILKLGFQGTTYQWDCYLQTNEEYDECSFYSVCPETISQDKIDEINEFITRANYGLPIGNFEMNLDTGEVRCKTSIDVEGNMLNFPLLNRLIEVNICLMERYLPGITAILDKNISPEDAILLVE